jgi:serine/threonine protein kinase/tetratricopeptide (TPR) repeat protein
MNATEYELLASNFETAVGLPPAQREHFIQSACTSDVMRRKLRRMLESDESAEDLSASTRVLSDALSTALAPGDDDIPETIGPYRLVRRLAVGGMGVVYLAEQTSPRRTVAIKILRADIREESLVRHFEREASILARLRHAGIAHVYDAGVVTTASGPRPYVVIEYIEGQPIDTYARERELPVRAIISLVIQACDAVEHAHARGVVHRDLKPGNLLVSPEGAVKVLDFGIARIMNAGDGEMISFPSESSPRPKPTVTIPHLLGTLAYMAPEQLEPKGDVDTRADVYALGVVLYELLTGELPIETHDRPLREAIEAVRSAIPAPISSFRRKYAGDLEFIVSTALARDRAVRYASAAALGEDLRRYLADRPIVARPPSLTYAFSKAAKRHRLAFISVGTAVVVLAVGGPIVAFAAADIARERGERLMQAERTLEASRLYEQASDLIQRRVQIPQARQLLDQAILTNPQFSLAYAARARLSMPSWHDIAFPRQATVAIDAVGDLITAHAAAGGTIPRIENALRKRALLAAPTESTSQSKGFPYALQVAGETFVWIALRSRPSSDAEIASYLSQAATCLDLAAQTITEQPRASLARAWGHIARFERDEAATLLASLAPEFPIEQSESIQRARGILYWSGYHSPAEPTNPFADATRCEEAWSQVLRTSPADVEAFIRIADAQHQQKRYDDALKTYGRAWNLAGTDASIPHAMGWVLRDAGRYVESAEQFGMAGALGVTPERNFFLAGESYAMAGQTDQAVECMKSHMTAYPADAIALSRYVDLLLAAGQPSEAQATVDRFASATDDTELAIEIQHSMASLDESHGTSLAERLSEILARDDDRAGIDAQLRRADTYASMGWYDRAADELQCAIDAGARSPHILLRAIGVHLTAGDRSKAEDTAAHLLSRADLPASTLASIAKSLDELGLCKEAIAAAEMARRLEPETRSHAVLLGSLLVRAADTQCQDPARAADLLGPLAARTDASLEEVDTYAEALMRVGRYREARLVAQRGVERDPTDLRRRLWIVIAAASAGDRISAQQEFGRVEDMLAETSYSHASLENQTTPLEPWYSQARAVVTFPTFGPFR